MPQSNITLPVPVRILSCQTRIDRSVHVLVRVLPDAPKPFRPGTEIETDFVPMPWAIRPGVDAELHIDPIGDWAIVPNDVEDQVWASDNGDAMRARLHEIGAWER